MERCIGRARERARERERDRERDRRASGEQVNARVPVVRVPFVHRNVELAQLEAMIRCSKNAHRQIFTTLAPVKATVPACLSAAEACATLTAVEEVGGIFEPQ